MSFALIIFVLAFGWAVATDNFSLLNLAIRRGIPDDFTLTRNLSTVAGGLLIALATGLSATVFDQPAFSMALPAASSEPASSIARSSCLWT